VARTAFVGALTAQIDGLANYAAAMKTDWNPLLKDQLDQPYWTDLQSFVQAERRHHEVYPAHDDVFAAMHLTSYDNVRVVILGQDPYHGPGQAHGLSFSVPLGVAVPPSLRNIYRELHDDLGIDHPGHGNLESWARHGVLLLNSVLTVRAHDAGSHRKRGWETFTDCVIQTVSENPEPVVFVLWGNFARSKAALIADHHYIIESPHPSPLSASRGFFGTKPFSRANEALIAAGREPVDWSP
jgi:uracil-DNA glycosylase